ncbi:MAG: hypothetical protein HY652_05785 [Acidobacteria bacterium]|nr:hypothetical protein [Acidobacteriota bacterium]
MKHQIPIKTDHWDVTAPGFTEVDLVSHSGPSAEGEFIHSLNLTDIHTTWVETKAVLGKGQVGVREALDEMRTALPFVLRGIDSDNGSEFISDHLYRYCREGQIQSSVKLLQKVRVGPRLKRLYEKPQTPLERLIASQQGDPVRIAELRNLRDRLDPFELSKAIDRKLDKIYQLAHQRAAPCPARTISNNQTQEPLTRIERESLRAISEAFGIPIHVRHRTKQG